MFIHFVAACQPVKLPRGVGVGSARSLQENGFFATDRSD